MLSFEEKMVLFAKKNGLTLTWQNLKFGFKWAKFICETPEEMSAILKLLWDKGTVWVDRWACYEGAFEGYVYAMDRNARAEFDKQQEAERNRIEDWWMRYRVADREERRLMACGEIE